MNLDKFGIAKIYPTVGKKWLARWDDGKKRTLHRDQWDPNDSNFGFHYIPLPDDRTLVIDGAGIATMPEDMKGQAWSPEARRLFVRNGDEGWTNTEMTIYARWRKRIWDTFQLRSRANHHGTKNLPYGYNKDKDRSCGFGNYEVIWGNGVTSSAKSRLSVEVIHSLYSNVVMNGPSYVPKQYEWIGYKFITRTVNNNSVKTEAWTNTSSMDQTQWKKECEFTFTNSNTTIPPLDAEKTSNAVYCKDRGDKISGDYQNHIMWLNPGYWNFVRINGGYDIQVKAFSVREIAPIL